MKKLTSCKRECWVGDSSQCNYMLINTDHARMHGLICQLQYVSVIVIATTTMRQNTYLNYAQAHILSLHQVSL